MEELKLLLSNPWELGGAITGFLCVWLAARENVLNWPVSMISVALYAKVFYDSKLYSDAALQIIFAGFQIYGWYQWVQLKQQKQAAPKNTPEVSSLNSRDGWLCVVAIGVLWPAWYALVISLKPDASFALWDALTLVMSVVAIFLQAKKILESWVLWIIADLIYIPVYAQKDLIATAVLYAVFLILAAYGFWQWKMSMNIQRNKILA